MLRLTLVLALAAISHAQQIGTQKPEEPLPLTVQSCTGPGSCSSESLGVTLDANWRWTHEVGSATNCYTGNQWDDQFCDTPENCAANCGLDGIPSSDWTGTYGVQSSGDELSIKFVTEGPFSTNIGSRVYLTEGDKYKMFYFMNNEIAFDVDASELDCGLNGALYTVEMQEDGGLADFSTNMCGAKYGTGYCDAQCPHDIKWIHGLSNTIDWTPSENDANSGKGHFGHCCMEFDLWEANKISQAYTSHPCDLDGELQCEDLECGDNPNERYQGVCDKDGCDFATYRNGDVNFYGPGGEVDSSQKVTVVTQFITSDGTENGDLVEVKRFYIQNGQTIETPTVTLPGGDFNSITDDFCNSVKDYFGETENDHDKKGGLTKMGESLKRGHVFVMSLWDDHEAFMLWLDSTYPPGATNNGAERGTCPPDSGKPEDVEELQADATVRFSNIRYGPIGSTTGF